MSRLKSLQQRNIAFGVVAVVLLAMLLLRPSRTGGVDEESLDLLFPDFSADQARVIKLQQAGGQSSDAAELVVSMKPDGKWVVTSQSGYPIVEGRQARLLDNLAQMRVRKIVTTRSETFGEYAGPSGWITVSVMGSGGKELAACKLGKIAKYPELFVQHGEGEDARIVQTINLTRDMASTDLTRWIEPRLFPDLLSDNVFRVEVEQPAFSRSVVLARKGESKKDVGFVVPGKDEGAKDQTWALVKPKVADAQSERVLDLVKSFTGLRISGVAAGRATDENRATFGLVEPDAIVRVRHRDINKQVTYHQVLVGVKTPDGSGQYVKIATQPWVFIVAPYQLADFRRSTEEYEYTPPEEPKDDEAGGADGDGEKEAAGSPDGVAAGSPDGTAAGSPDGDAASLPPPALEMYEVVLTKVGDKRVDLIKAIRAATELGLADAEKLIGALPATVKGELSRDEADKLAEALRAAGAEVEVKAGG